MSFKYSIGQAVEYTPRGCMVGLFTVVRHMPEEFHVDRRYVIKNLKEGFARNVMEFDLSATVKHQDEYAVPVPLRHTSHY